MNFFWYSLKKSKFSFYFIVNTAMCASVVITKHKCHGVDVQCFSLRKHSVFKYTENFTTEKSKIFRQKIQIFFIFLLKT